jgi:hypothetical protein
VVAAEADGLLIKHTDSLHLQPTNVQRRNWSTPPITSRLHFWLYTMPYHDIAPWRRIVVATLRGVYNQLPTNITNFLSYKSGCLVKGVVYSILLHCGCKARQGKRTWETFGVCHAGTMLWPLTFCGGTSIIGVKIIPATVFLALSLTIFSVEKWSDVWKYEIAPSRARIGFKQIRIFQCLVTESPQTFLLAFLELLSPISSNPQSFLLLHFSFRP